MWKLHHASRFAILLLDLERGNLLICLNAHLLQAKWAFLTQSTRKRSTGHWHYSNWLFIVQSSTWVRSLINNGIKCVNWNLKSIRYQLIELNFSMSNVDFQFMRELIRFWLLVNSLNRIRISNSYRSTVNLNRSFAFALAMQLTFVFSWCFHRWRFVAVV